MNQLKALWSILVLVALFATSAEAGATSVSGKLSVFVDTGQYCDPALMNCTHSRFLGGSANPKHNETCQPVRDAVVQIIDDDSGAIVMTTNTDSNGNYATGNFFWLGGDLRVRWVMQHHSGRFRVGSELNPSATHAMSTPDFSATSNSTHTVDRCFTQNAYNQAWFAASRMWREALSYSQLMGANFFDVTILAELPNVDGNPAPDEADYQSGTNTVRLGLGSWNYPLSDLQHEMGHAAHRLAKPEMKSVPAYNWCSTIPTPSSCLCPDGSCDGDGHNLTSPEWRAASFSEGLASFLGLVAMYWYNNPDPRYCLNDIDTCTTTNTNTVNVEIRSTALGACNSHPTQPFETRTELSNMRYLWDVYDAVVDSAYNDNVGANTSSNFEFYTLVGELATYASGIGNGQVNEPWGNTALTATDDLDGRSAADYRAKLNASTTAQYTNNCSP